MKLKIFFSWEMETDSQGFDNKNFLIVCISHALDELKKQHELLPTILMASHLRTEKAA